MFSIKQCSLSSAPCATVRHNATITTLTNMLCLHQNATTVYPSLDDYNYLSVFNFHKSTTGSKLSKTEVTKTSTMSPF